MTRRDVLKSAALAAVSASAAAPPIDLEELSIADIQSGHFTSRALTEACLARIDTIDRRGPALHAVIELAAERQHLPHSLKMKCTTAPFFRGNIGDGFGEVPAVTVKVLSIVLALAIGLIYRFTQDEGTVPSRALAVPFRILDAYLNDV